MEGTQSVLGPAPLYFLLRMYAPGHRQWLCS